MAGTFVGFLPLLGWHKGKSEDQKCFFVGVMDYNYLVFLYFATIITPSLLLAAFYAHIYRVVLKQLRQIVTMNPVGSNGGSNNGHVRANGGTMLRMLGAAQKREVKATQNLSIIVLFFVICWIPLYTINCVEAFCDDCEINETLTYFCIILSHLNSAGNPLLYAYHLRDFRAALKSYLLGLFGIREKNPPCMERNCRNSLASNTCSHYRLNYIRNAQTHSPSCPNKFARSSMDNGKRVPICMPIVTTTAAVAAVSAGERPNREMWMITEVPSSSISENNMERDIAVFPDVASIVNDMSESSSSGQVNSGYVEGPIDDFEMGDDDVFYPDTSALSANGSNFESDISEICKRNDKPVEITPKLTKRNSRNWCLSSSSPQLSRSLFLVEAEVCKSKLCESERRSSVVDRKIPNSTSFSATGDFSPARSLKLSPFKAVGDFLLHHTSNKHSKSANKIEDVSYKDCSNNTLAIVPYDANRNGSIINQRQTNDTADS